jgi:RNA polymerase sigma-70 factor (ECF subfamily)
MTVASGEPLDQLIGSVRRGDRDAIAAVYIEVAPALRGFLRRRVPHGEVADDLVEQTFVELIEGCERIQGDGRSLRAWLFRAARNNLYDWRKRADRRGDHELTARHAATLEDTDADPADKVAAADLDPTLVAALEKLTDEQRDVVELRLVGGLSLAQVADITGRRVGAVKALQHRAVRRLMAVLADEPDRPISPDS